MTAAPRPFVFCADSDPSPARQRLALGLGALFLLTLLAYAPAFHAGFVFDDELYLTRNPLIRERDGLYRFWFRKEFTDYYPLTLTTLWLEWRLWGENPAGYHATNVALHAANVVLLCLLLHRLRMPGAWFAAALFAVHPVNVQSVAWISERKNTLALLLVLASFLAYLRFDQDRRPTCYGASLLLFFGALLSKTAVVFFPFVLLGSAAWQRGRITSRDWLLSVPFFALALALGLFTLWWFDFGKHVESEWSHAAGVLGAVTGAARAVWFYLGKAILPVGLTIVYPSWNYDPATARAFMPVLLLASVFAWLWIFGHGGTRPFLFAFSYYVLALGPALLSARPTDLGYAPVADHWQYFALIGIVSLVAGGATRWAGRRPRALRWVTAMVGLLVIGLFSVMTWARCHVFHSNDSLWAEAVERNPSSWRAHNNLGVALAERGEWERAIRHYRAALALQPAYAHAHFNLARALWQTGRAEEALQEYGEALRADPKYTDAHVERALLLGERGRHQEAIHHYRLALEWSPRDARIHNNLGLALAAAGQTEAALARFREAIRLDPSHAEAHANLGLELRGQGNLAEAVDHLRQAVQLAPGIPGMHAALGQALLEAGQVQSATASLLEAIRLNPFHAPAHSHLALAMCRAGQWAGAIEHYGRALQLRPSWPAVQASLAWLLVACPDPSLRNVSQAASLAERAASADGPWQWLALDALAAAYAQMGQWDLARTTAEMAVEKARVMGEEHLAQEIASRLDHYRRHQPPSSGEPCR